MDAAAFPSNDKQQNKISREVWKKGGMGGFALKSVVATHAPVVSLAVEIARQDALRVCNPNVDRPFASLEDACERLLPYHVVADYDADDVNERFLDSAGRILSRSQLWNESLTAKINEFKSILDKQISTFNMMTRNRTDGDMRAEERMMVEQVLLQDEKHKLIEIKLEVEARERAEREAEARLKEAIAQEERVRAEAQARAQAQAQAEALARAEAARISVQAEAARMQAHAEVARIHAHAEAVRQAQAEAVRLQVHAETSRFQAQGGAVHRPIEPYHFVASQMQAGQNTGLESGSHEQQVGIVDEMLDGWETLNEDASESNPDDLFNDDQVGVDREFQDMDLLAPNSMQSEWKEAGTLDLNSLNTR